MAAARRPILARDAARGVRFDVARFVLWLVPVALIVPLGLSNGGYGIAERSEIAIVVWWTVLVGTAVGALRLGGASRAGRAMLAGLGAYAAWTALSLSWTDSDERTAIELARAVSYLGVFALALGAQGQGRWRPMLDGVASALALLCAIAILSRLEPGWFPERITGIYLPGIEIERRLAYPINYSSGLGALAALTMPLLLAASASARTLIGQALAAAALPIVALTLWLTTSSLSVPAAGLALIAFFILAPDRLPKLATLAAAAIGSAILVATIEHREALDRGLPTPEALAEGDEMKLIILAVSIGVALAQAGIGLAVRRGGRPGWMQVSRLQAWGFGAVLAAAVLILATTAVISGEASERWQQFTGESGESPVGKSRTAQLFDISSSGRYEYWRSAVEANATDPWKGIGPGTFEFWYSTEGENPGFVRDAHSLYVESLAELGIVGLLLIAGFSVAALAIACARVVRAPPELRLGLAAAGAGCVTFIAAAAVDWIWELSVLPIAFVILVAVAVAAGLDPLQRPRRSAQAWRRFVAPVLAGAVSLAAIVAIALPLAGDAALRESREAAAAGELDLALERAADAIAIQPYAATPRLQQALVQEELGDIDGALASARAAAEREPTNWRTWFILSRIEVQAGNAKAAVDAVRRARALNPRSAIFAR